MLKPQSVETVSFGEALPIHANAQAHSKLQASAEHNTGSGQARWRANVKTAEKSLHSHQLEHGNTRRRKRLFGKYCEAT
jgi:hypothetical protein